MLELLREYEACFAQLGEGGWVGTVSWATLFMECCRITQRPIFLTGHQ